MSDGHLNPTVKALSYLKHLSFPLRSREKQQWIGGCVYTHTRMHVHMHIEGLGLHN